MMISTNGFKRKSPSSDNNSNNTTTKRFRDTAYDGWVNKKKKGVAPACPLSCFFRSFIHFSSPFFFLSEYNHCRGNVQLVVFIVDISNRVPTDRYFHPSLFFSSFSSRVPPSAIHCFRTLNRTSLLTLHISNI
jgi:hypothetical protein